MTVAGDHYQVKQASRAVSNLKSGAQHRRVRLRAALPMRTALRLPFLRSVSCLRYAVKNCWCKEYEHSGQV